MVLRALDLFCCAGGASVGLARAGFEVVGVDKDFHKNYPFPMIVCDAMEIGQILAIGDFDFIWASPPCQKWSRGTPRTNKEKHPDLIEETRQLLARSGALTAIENVPDAPIRPDVVMTGCHFGLNTYRRRHFELNFTMLWQKPGPRFGPATRPGAVTVAGGGRTKDDRVSNWSSAMGIDWMNRRELAQAIPPAYSEAIGREAIRQIMAGRADQEMAGSDVETGPGQKTFSMNDCQVSACEDVGTLAGSLEVEGAGASLAPEAQIFAPPLKKSCSGKPRRGAQ